MFQNPFQTRNRFLFYVLVRYGFPMCGLIILIYLILKGYSFTWTGFGSKTLWDWIQLLIVPLVIAIAGWWLGRIERTIESNVNSDRFRETTLQSYLLQMNDLLIKHKSALFDAEDTPTIRVANLHTINIFQSLQNDVRRKSIVLIYLYEAALIRFKDIHQPVTIVSIEEKDFTGINLGKVKLRKSNFRGCVFRESNFHSAEISGCNFDDAVFNNSILTAASLKDASFRNARLDGAILNDIEGNRSDFENASLHEASTST